METFFVSAQKYRIIECLGEGANSCVYRAFKESPEGSVRFEVALKILKSEKLVSIWRNEFDRLKQVKSAYCVRLLGWETTDRGPALLVEYVRGVTLSELAIWAQLNQLEINEIATQVRRGLHDLADCGLSHGDLSPHNIMIDDSGQVKLIDFGVGFETKNKNSGRLITPKYAAPNVLKGNAPDLASDLKSLDLVLAELTPSEANLTMLLAEKVKRAMAVRQQKRAPTARIEISKTNGALGLRRFSMHVASLVVVLFSLGISQSESKADRYVSLARLVIRSTNWLEIRINGQSLGYAPIDVLLPTGRDLNMQWFGRHKSGQRTLHLRNGEMLNLEEYDFQ